MEYRSLSSHPDSLGSKRDGAIPFHYFRAKQNHFLKLIKRVNSGDVNLPYNHKLVSLRIQNDFPPVALAAQ